MIRSGIVVVTGWAVVVAGGCASRNVTPPLPQQQAQTHAPDDPAFLPLDQIQPAPMLGAAATRPATGPAPLDAVQWFAEARGALARGDRATAADLLERALALDPNSAEIYEELGKAYGAQDKAMTAFEKALALDPDNLELQERVGRQYLIKNRPDDALRHFRLALQTKDYQVDNEEAAIVDFFLARTLQRKGYDRAALDRYAMLVRRLESPAISSRSNPELLGLLSQPEVLYREIGELYAKHKEYDQAAHAFELAAERVPDNFDYQSKMVQALVDGRHGAEAQTRAAEVVTRFHASADSLKLLREVYQRLGQADQLVDALTVLRGKHPNDQALLFALADALSQSGRMAEAEKLLLDQAQGASNADEIVRRLFELYDQRDDVEGAMRLLVNALASRPDSVRQLSPLWSELLKPSRRNRVRVQMIQKLKVAPQAEASKLFWVSRVAEIWNRDALARSALEQGAAIKPAFAPLYRALISEYASRPDWDDAQKAAESEKLVQAARQQGNVALAAELEGRLLLRQRDKAEQASEKIAQAIQLGEKSVDVQLLQATALKLANQNGKAEQLLWKIISDVPTCEEAYIELFRYYFEISQPSKAINVLAKWLNADPANVHARALQARILKEAGRLNAAESELLSLFHDQPENSEILAALYDFYSDTNRIDDFINKLEQERQARPDNREAVEQLALIYSEHHRLPEALRVLDAARQAVASDPDLLYYIAHLYGRVGQSDTEEKILEDVVRLDPHHAPANNDLGYSWADASKNLEQAETLIRLAVEAEPDNQSFLDSMGWVLYKRSKFSEALGFFEKAIGPASRPDPVVLDHMGDVLYRLNNGEAAVKQWKRAKQRLDQMLADRDDLKKLRIQLIQKLRQYERGQPVDVAPTAGTASSGTQAKN